MLNLARVCRGKLSNSLHAAANRRDLGEILLTQLVIDHGQALVIASAPRIFVICVLILREPLWRIDVHSCRCNKQMLREDSDSLSVITGMLLASTTHEERQGRAESSKCLLCLQSREQYCGERACKDEEEGSHCTRRHLTGLLPSADKGFPMTKDSFPGDSQLPYYEETVIYKTQQGCSKQTS